MKTHTMLMTCMLTCHLGTAAEKDRIVDAVTPQRPRIIMTDKRSEEIRRLLKTDHDLQVIVKNLKAVGDYICTTDPVTRGLVGKSRKNILGTSRRALSRIMTLGMLYRIDGDEKWKARALKEMKAVCEFSDWHPSHFLDTAEMSAAVAIGYDWLYNDLSLQDRIFIRDALIKHGLEAGLKGGWWVRGNNNWNQVCHAGMVLTALALAPDRADDCETLLASAKANHKTGLVAYTPAGVYPEGPIYWNYGTSFSILMASALDSAIGTDWGILDYPGFKESFEFRMHVQTPTGKFVNYADGPEDARSVPMHLYLAAKTGTAGYASFALESLNQDFEKIANTDNAERIDARINRMLALAVAWYVPEVADTTPPLDWFGTGESKVHVAFMRSAWDDKNALFASLKAGKLEVNHGHLDNGSFIMESDGVRWAGDMGGEGAIYRRNDAWSTKQTSPRWTFFRANNFGHSTLTIGGTIQQVKGKSPIITTGSGTSPFAIADLSAAYYNQATSVKRGIMMPARKSVLIRDEIAGVAKGTTIRWNMMTRTAATISDDGTCATLTYNGKKLTMKLVSPHNAQFAIKDATPTRDFEEPNEDWQRVVIDTTSSGKDLVILVAFMPEGTENMKTPIMPLDQW